MKMGSVRNDSVLIRALNLASTIAVLIIMAILVAWLYFALYVANPPITVDQPFLVDKEEYYPGDDIGIIARNVCRYTDAAATSYVTYFEVNTHRFYPAYQQDANSIPEGCSEEYIRVETVPLLPAGTYERRSRVVYDVGLGVQREVELTTVPFKVLPLLEEIESLNGSE